MKQSLLPFRYIIGCCFILVLCPTYALKTFSFSDKAKSGNFTPKTVTNLNLLFKKANTDTVVFNKKRFTAIIAAEAAIYTGSLIGLNQLWYKNYPRSSFHLFNDNKEWLQMDKVGHLTTSYYVGRIGIDLMKWGGLSNNKAIWYGGVMGSVYQSTIEILDGFSSEWGFSVGDFTANTLGTALLIGQELGWKQQRVVLKYFFHKSNFAPYRPEQLGYNYVQNLIKDYNGQTYWASINISSFIKGENKFPKWLNIAFGYGAEGMTGAFINPVVSEKGISIPAFQRYRQYYLSIDADLTRVKCKSKLLKTLFNTIGFIKIPSPTFEWNKQGGRFWVIY